MQQWGLHSYQDFKGESTKHLQLDIKCYFSLYFLTPKTDKGDKNETGNRGPGYR
jgi:hypothetical protein